MVISSALLSEWHHTLNQINNGHIVLWVRSQFTAIVNYVCYSEAIMPFIPYQFLIIHSFITWFVMLGQLCSYHY